MTDMIYEAALFTSRALSYLTEAWCLHRFYQVLCGEGRLRWGGRRTAWLVPASYFILMLICANISWQIPFDIAYAAVLVLVFAVSCISYQGHAAGGLYLIVTFMAIESLSYIFGLAVNEGLFAVISQVDGRLYAAGYAEGSVWYMISFLCYALPTTLIRMALFCLLTYLVLRRFACWHYELDGPALLFLMLPELAAIVWGLTANQFYLRLPHEVQNLGWLVLWTAGAVLAAGSIYVCLVLILRIKDAGDGEKERLVIHRQMENISSHIAKVEQLYADIRGLKHDMRGHIAGIGRLLGQGAYEEAQDYAGKLTEAVERIEPLFQTGNPVTDIVISEYGKLAADRGVRFLCDFVFPKQAGIDAFDICIILQNVLDNAFEGCSSLGDAAWVEIAAGRHKNGYVIKVKNSFQGVLRRNQDGLPASTKGDTGIHGLGLRNVRRVAERYFGAIEAEWTEGVFTLTVLLQCVAEQ